MAKLAILCASYNNTENQLRVLIHSVLGSTLTDLSLYILQDGPDDTARKVCESIIDPRLKYEESVIRRGIHGFSHKLLNRGVT